MGVAWHASGSEIICQISCAQTSTAKYCQWPMICDRVRGQRTAPNQFPLPNARDQLKQRHLLGFQMTTASVALFGPLQQCTAVFASRGVALRTDGLLADRTAAIRTEPSVDTLMVKFVRARQRHDFVLISKLAAADTAILVLVALRCKRTHRQPQHLRWLEAPADVAAHALLQLEEPLIVYVGRFGVSVEHCMHVGEHAAHLRQLGGVHVCNVALAPRSLSNDALALQAEHEQSAARPEAGGLDGRLQLLGGGVLPSRERRAQHEGARVSWPMLRHQLSNRIQWSATIERLL
mmetsp:Transcript_32242/g.75131  ORF Transcript_32242/g.75131 Transcript_32242/m.75131 type:complete len:292 (+) Transcript_32242:401-1276(+)